MRELAGASAVQHCPRAGRSLSAECLLAQAPAKCALVHTLSCVHGTGHRNTVQTLKMRLLKKLYRAAGGQVNLPALARRKPSAGQSRVEVYHERAHLSARRLRPDCQSRAPAAQARAALQLPMLVPRHSAAATLQGLRAPAQALQLPGPASRSPRPPAAAAARARARSTPRGRRSRLNPLLPPSRNQRPPRLRPPPPQRSRLLAPSPAGPRHSLAEDFRPWDSGSVRRARRSCAWRQGSPGTARRCSVRPRQCRELQGLMPRWDARCLRRHGRLGSVFTKMQPQLRPVCQALAAYKPFDEACCMTCVRRMQ